MSAQGGGRRRGGGCGRSLVGGCVTLLVLIGLGAAVVAINFDAIKETRFGRGIARMTEEGRRAVVETVALQNALREEFAAEGVSIDIRLGTGDGGRALGVTLTHPAFAADATEEELDAHAREVAVFVRDHYGLIDTVEVIEVGLERRLGSVVRASSTTEFRFEVSDL